MDEKYKAILKKMLEMGFQVEVKVLDILLKDYSAEEVIKLLTEVADKKRVTGSAHIISLNDFNINRSREYEEKYSVPVTYEIKYDFWSSGKIIDDPRGYGILLKSRFEKFDRLLRRRNDLRNVRKIGSLRRISLSRDSSIIVRGLVMDKQLSDGRLLLEIEDETGTLTLVSENMELYDDVVLDEMIIAEVYPTEKGFVVQDLRHLDIPDVPRKRGDDLWVVFISDLHFGSKYFDEESFARFVNWITGKFGDKDIVDNIKYLVIVGDVIDRGSLAGRETSFRDIYESFVGYLKRVDGRIITFILPGDSDSSVNVLPQPPIFRSLGSSLYDLSSCIMVGNPVLLRLNGVDVLAYHGQSMNDLRSQLSAGAEVRISDLMKRLLRARHLSPTLGLRTGVFPMSEDVLVIDDVPDIFVCGHMHSMDIENYKGVLLLSLPSWLKGEEGMHGARAAVVNLKTFDVIWRG